MRFLLFIFVICCSPCLLSQPFTVTTIVTDATCSANGRIDITVTGGSGNFRYDLVGECGESFQSLADPFFTTLRPCNYELLVTDRTSGVTDTSQVAVVGSQEILSAEGSFDGCDAFILLAGGLPPYEIIYSIDDGEEISRSVTESIGLGEIGDGLVDGGVTDQCGNTRRFTLDGASRRVRNFSLSQEPDSILLVPVGGVGPYTYSITSDLGTFTSLNGKFPYDEVGCNLEATVNGACRNAPTTKALELSSRVRLDCINYVDGTVTVFVSPPGIQPYTFTVVAGDTVIESNSTTITGIPSDAASVEVTAVDGCGNLIAGAVRTTQTRLITTTPGESCDDTNLNFRIGRTCLGDNNYPITVTCETCPGSPVVTQNADGQTLLFNYGAAPGDYELRIEDACGEVQRCRDSVRLELIPACDSIIANVIQAFECDNGTISRRALKDTSLRFRLLDGNGVVLVDENLSGRLPVSGPGTYFVEVTSSCGRYADSVLIEPGAIIDPLISIEPDLSAGGDGICRLTYRTLISQSEGPYELSSLANDSIRIKLDDFDQDECNNFTVPLLLPPGDYRLVSLSRCGEKLFTLPELMEDRIDSITVVANCPGGNSVRMDGLLRDASDWRDYFEGLGFRGIIQNNEADYLIINGRRYNRKNISNLDPGQYTVYAALGFSEVACPIDSATFLLPEYEPVSLAVKGNYVCGDSGEAPLQIQPRFGNAPYVVRRIDCNNASTTVSSFDLEAGEVAMIDADGVGVYCFVVEDACGLTSDFQVEVRSLADRIAVAYECTPAIRLTSDTLDGVFTWFGPDGEVVATGNDVTVTPSLEDRIFRLEVATDLCLLTAPVDVPGRLVAPQLSLNVDAEATQCGNAPFLVTATTDDASVITFAGADAGAELRVTEPGIYRVSATNDLGCVTEDSVTVSRAPVPNPTIQPTTDFCPGSPAAIGIVSEPNETLIWGPTGATTDTISLGQAGVYSVLVTNEFGCEGVDTFRYVPPQPITFLATPDSVSCFGVADGAIKVVAAGGTGEFSFTAGGQTFTLPAMAMDLSARAYGVEIVDENGCAVDTSVVVGSPDSLQLDLGRDVFPVFGDVVRVDFVSSLDSVTGVFLSPDLIGAEVSAAGLSFRATQSKDLVVTLLDSRGCPATDDISIIVDRALRLYAPTAFSPNGDGVNDRFFLQGADDIASIATIRVYDRWGSEVYGRTNLEPNNPAEAWDGSAPDGRPLNPGTFIWQAEVIFFDGTKRLFSGGVNLLR